MNNSNYIVEFNGYEYIVLFGGRGVAAFANSEAAYEAKRSFENKPAMSEFDKTPPAMRVAKELYHRQRMQ